MQDADFVVLGVKPGKMDEIAEKGVTTITEDEFLAKLGLEPASKKRKL